MNVVKHLLTRECFVHNPKLNKLTNNMIFIIGYSLSQSLSSIISAMNKNNLDKFYNNYNSPIPTLFKGSTRNTYKVKKQYIYEY